MDKRKVRLALIPEWLGLMPGIGKVILGFIHKIGYTRLGIISRIGKVT